MIERINEIVKIHEPDVEVIELPKKGSHKINEVEEEERMNW